MDMAVANLLKHKIRFELDSEKTERYEPDAYKRYRYYSSLTIQNVESVDASLFKPFVFYAISKVLHEDRDIIVDRVTIEVGVFGLEEREHRRLVCYLFEDPTRPLNKVEFSSINPEVYIRTIPDHLINQPFFVWVYVNCYYVSDDLREALDRQYREAFTSDDEDEVLPSPPIETHKEDRCVICLELTLNILYLDCMHIAVCDSCDRSKRTRALRKNCDVCRAEISKRIKI